MLKSSYKIVTVWGIPIKVHMALVLILLVLPWEFGFWTAIVFGLGMFTSIALHELGHSIVAIGKGCRVSEILLLPIGGMARMENIPSRPADEFQMAIAGPAVSLLLFAILSRLGALLPLPLVNHELSLNVVQLLGWLNLVLAVFNLIPAFPMDGGRVLRSWLTPRLGRLRATFIAATVGRIAAVIFGLIGLRHQQYVLVVIAIYIYFAAGREYRLVELQEKAKTFGLGFSAFGPSEPGVDTMDHEEVVIGPPPYEQGSGSRAAIHHVHERRRNPWQKMFE